MTEEQVAQEEQYNAEEDKTAGEEKVTEERTRVEEFDLSGDEVVGKVKQVLHEGNIRRISLQTQEGKTLIEVPLTVGVAGAAVVTLVVPVWAAIGAIAALVADLRLVVERVE